MGTVPWCKLDVVGPVESFEGFPSSVLGTTMFVELTQVAVKSRPFAGGRKRQSHARTAQSKSFSN